MKSESKRIRTAKSNNNSVESSWRQKLFDILQIGDKSNFASRAFDFFIVIVIVTNITVMFLQTFSQLSDYFGIFRYIELVTTGIFCVEYILRIITADYLYPTAGKVKSRLLFLKSFDGIVDLLTILTGFIAFRMLRVVRIFHLFRLNAQYDSFNIITGVLKEKKNQILSSVFIILVLMMASSLCMYSAEHAAQPEVFSNAFSGIWWSVSTVLTVGYGDIYPITILGKTMAIIISFLGVGAVAIPTGIISAGFVESYTRNQNLTNARALDLNEIVEFRIDKKNAHKSISEMEADNHLHIYLILRNDISVLPDDDIRLMMNDIIIARVL